ncbi:MAG: glutamine-hydrolyzing GMP synthase [Verrucomicrobiales bacterium]|nr:glutamine-hydrolyzing GMP synthase [Verrucomicrobiales bacterium]MCP5519855.1 glutamine-hydrolyzing GMP synthase [Verrucomicrobiales bacterium]MCP5527202.1 glutamine-hydrolyzing GMP synthase [Verrucomicrobiales bacterium]
MNESIVILDFGSQYTQVIARRVRECRVYSLILPYHTPPAEIARLKPKGIILSGGPSSVYDDEAPLPDPGIFKLRVPILGICFGVQLLGHFLGGRVERGLKREYGKGTLQVQDPECALFNGLPASMQVWNSHADKLTRLPRGFRTVAVTENSDFAAIEDRKRRFFGLQFHPEVAHTPQGREVIANFVHRVCGCGSEWTMRHFISQAVEEIRGEVGDERVILGLSGGVDSSVVAALIHQAIGDQLTCIFVNNGLLRAREAEVVRRVFGQNFHIKLVYEDATRLFLQRLKGVTDPERKRKIIGRTFIQVFEAGTKRAGKAKFLAQGTLYPDVIESVPIAGNPAALIKSHHNVGGLPKRMKFVLLEPVKRLFKDEVRLVGRELGLPDEIVYRQPFPGPGLAVRILGEVTPRRLDILRQADAIVIEEMKAADWYYRVWQSFAVLLPVRSVGVMGDERTYDYTLAFRAVESQDGMTADWVRLPHDLLEKVAGRIVNEVKGVNRCVYDITSKPPGTIEWE